MQYDRERTPASGMRPQLPAELSPDQLAAGRLHVVHESRQIEIGRQLRQDVHVAGLALNSAALPPSNR